MPSRTTAAARRSVSASDPAACAARLKALADATRLEMVALVARAGAPLCACEIEAHFELSQSTISHHLRLLRQAGILDAERRGTWAFYSLAEGAGDPLAEVLAILRS